MARIIIRNTAISGSRPTNLVQGELLLNVTDGKLYYGSSSANIVKEFTGSASGGGGGTVNTGSLLTTASFNAYTGSSTSFFAGTASFALTSSRAITASYALNGGVTQLLAGPNVTLSPASGLGQVTVSATLSGSTIFNTATGSYGSFYDTTTQTNPVANIPRSMSLNETDISNGVSVSGSTNPFNTYIKTQNAGVYDIQFSAQVEKTDSGTDEIVIWLRKNGTDLTDTATTITLSGNNDKQVAAWNWFVTSAANDYYQIIWISADTGMRLLAETISATHPGIPSVIVTANRVDQFLSNTGSFSGSFTGEFTGSLFGTSSWATNASTASFITGSTNAFIQGGNSFGATALLGTNDNQSLALETSGSTRMFISSSGNVGIGTSTPTSLLHISGASSAALFRVDSPSGDGIVYVSGSGRLGFNTTSSLNAQATYNNRSADLGFSILSEINTYANGGYGFRTNGAIKATDYYLSNSTGNIYNLTGLSLLHFNASNNVGIGVSSSLLSKVHIRGSGTTSATTAFLVQNSTPATLFSILDNGNVTVSGSNFDMINNAGAYSGFTLNSNASSTMYVGAQSAIAQIKTEAGGNAWIGAYQPGMITRLGYSGSAGGATYVNFSTNGANSGLHVTHNGGSDLMTVTSAGNVGIGHPVPSASLHISGASSANLLRIDSPASSSIVFVSGSGRVGIRTSNPTASLDVRGNLFVQNIADTDSVAQFGSNGGGFNIAVANRTDISIKTNAIMTSRGTGTTFRTTAGEPNGATLGVIGSGATSATTALLVQNSTPTNLLSINDIGQVSFTSPTMSLAVSQSAFNISPIISASAVVGGQYYGVNITPTFYQTTGSQTETALRVVPTFTASNATATGGSNVIADFGSTSAGSQLTVTDVTSGSIYMVNDVSGLPILEATSDWQFRIYDYPKVILQKSGSNIAISGSFAINNNNATPVTENTLTLGTPLAGGAGEGGQLGLQAAGGSYTSASFIDTWQDQFRILRGPNNGSNAGLMYMNLQSGNTQFVGAVTASAFSGLPNDYLYAIRSGSNQTVGSNWVSQDIIFNSTVVSKGISFNTTTGVASLTGGKVYRVTARLAWAAASAYNLQYSCYTSANTQIGPTVEIIQSTNSTNNISDGTLEFIYAPASNTDIKIRTTANNTALSGEQIRYDLNTQFIIQQIA